MTEMSREEYIKELILYLAGKAICMCPATKNYWETHYREIEFALVRSSGMDASE